MSATTTTTDVRSLLDAAAALDVAALAAYCEALDAGGLTDDGGPDWDAAVCDIDPAAIDWFGGEEAGPGGLDVPDGWVRFPVRDLTVRSEPVWVRITWDTTVYHNHGADDAVWTVFNAWVEAAGKALLVDDRLVDYVHARRWLDDTVDRDHTGDDRAHRVLRAALAAHARTALADNYRKTATWEVA